MYKLNKKLLSGGLAICLTLSPVIATAGPLQQGVSSGTSISNYYLSDRIGLGAVSAAESDALDAINSASAEEMEDVITANAKTLGLNLKDYDKLTDKSPVNIALVGKDFANKAAVKKAFNAAVSTQKKAEAAALAAALKVINGATVNKMGIAIIENASTLGLDLTDYTNLDSKSQVHKDLVGKKFKTKEAVQKAFDAAVAKEKALEEAPALEAVAVVAINVADAEGMGDVITANAEILGLVLTDYTKLTDKASVHSALVGQGFLDKTEVKSAFDEAVSTQKEAEARAAAEAKAVDAINTATVAKMGAVIKTNAKILGLELTDYIKLKNKAAVHTALCNKGFEDKAAIKTAFDEAVTTEMEAAAVTAINKAGLTKMGAAIAANAEILGLDLTDYNGLTDKSSVYKALFKKGFITKAAIKTAFDN
ncbi:MAG: hypothetical protein WA125_09410, partial [Desulfosporosinus sp.]